MMDSWAACLAILAVVSGSPLKEWGKRDGCNQDNCYRALDGFQRTSEPAFCSEYLHTFTKTAPAVIATVESCGPPRISSGCSCLMLATASVSTLPPLESPTTPSDQHATPYPATATAQAAAAFTTTLIITTTAPGMDIATTGRTPITISGLDMAHTETLAVTITKTAADVVTTVIVPGAGDITTFTVPGDPVTTTLTLSVETHTATLSSDSVTLLTETKTTTFATVTVASTVTATINPNNTDTTPTTTPNPICPLADKTTITTSSNNTRGDRPLGTLSLYTIHCHTDYNTGYVLFASAATDLQQCAQQCTNYTCQHDTECTAATYSFGQCYGRSGTLKEQAIQYTDAMVLSTAIVINSTGDQ